MIQGYTSNVCIQMLIALLKKHGIRRAVISPGGSDLELAAGLQYSGDFKLISVIDERGAAYMACGIAEQSGEPVVIICTESTASRNYMPGLTEAYYRKLPVLAVTAVHGYSEIGHLKPQVIDRSVSPKDVFRRKVHLQPVRDNNDYWENEIKINAAILELTRHGGGPVHIDLPCTNKNYNFDVKILPEVKKINRYYFGQKLPELSEGRIAIFLGSHAPFSDRETAVMDAFCASHNAVVFCGHGSGYYGKYRVQSALAAAQKCEYEIFENISTLIHMGEATADEPTMGRMVRAAQGWRVNPDGELRDTFKKLTNVFEMPEAVFFGLLYKER